MKEHSSAELKAFYATARCGSMSGAAKMLGLRQPTVSSHIASLEQRYGVELFHRKGRGVTLTEFGKMLHEITHRAHQAEDQARLLLLSASCHYQGHLKICAIGPYNVTPMIRHFRQQREKVRISVAIGDSRQIVERILDYQDDVGVLLHHVDQPQIHSVPYRRQPLMVFAARHHPLTQKSALRLADLEGQEFVLREDGSTTRKVFEAGLAAVGITIRCALEMGSREAVSEAVAQGLGLGVVAQNAFTQDQRLVPLPIRDLHLHTHVHVICLRERLQAPLIDHFLATVQALKQRA